MSLQAFVARRVVTPEGIRPAAILVEGERIQAVVSPDQVPADGCKLHDFGEVAILPGLVDSQSTLLNQGAVAMDSFFIAEIEKAIIETGCKPHRMVSGAGHDAMILAEKVPTAMIFLRTPGGVSHHPAESVAGEDVEKAFRGGLHLLDQLASSPEFYKRINRE